MEWLPKSGMTLTHLVLNTEADNVRYDLAVDVNGGEPSRMSAGLLALPTPVPVPATPEPTLAPPAPTIVPTEMPVEAVFAAPAHKTARSAWPLTLALLIVPVIGIGAWALARKAKA